MIEKKVCLKDLTLQEFEYQLVESGEKPYRAAQVFSWIYGRGATSFEEMTDLPKALRGKLAEQFSLQSLEVAESFVSTLDRTSKYLFRTEDGELIESVLIPSPDRLTICISSQVGCKLACRFCASGMRGVERNLSPGEIVDQVFLARKFASPDTIRLSELSMLHGD